MDVEMDLEQRSLCILPSHIEPWLGCAQGANLDRGY